jgi:hypothetical protein
MDARLDLIENPLEQWQAFGAEHRTRIAGDAQWALPWMLDSASLEAVASVLGQLPPPLQQLYRDQWQPAYAELRPWA